MGRAQRGRQILRFPTTPTGFKTKTLAVNSSAGVNSSDLPLIEWLCLIHNGTLNRICLIICELDIQVIIIKISIFNLWILYKVTYTFLVFETNKKLSELNTYLKWKCVNAENTSLFSLNCMVSSPGSLFGFGNYFSPLSKLQCV